MINQVAASPYRDEEEARTRREAYLTDALVEAASALASCPRRSRRERRRLGGRVRRLRAELDELVEAPPPRRRRRTHARIVTPLLLVIACLVAAAASSSGRAAHAPPSSFDPNAIDGSDTLPRVELEP